MALFKEIGCWQGGEDTQPLPRMKDLMWGSVILAGFETYTHIPLLQFFKLFRYFSVVLFDDWPANHSLEDVWKIGAQHIARVIDNCEYSSVDIEFDKTSKVVI